MRQGLALILVVATLGILAVLGSAFAVLSRLERRAATQRVLGTQAFLLSRSGIEDALARLGKGQDPDVHPSRYGGEDWDLSSRWGAFGWPLSAMEAANEVHAPGVPDRESCPARHAMRPSYFLRLSPAAAMPTPATFPVDGKMRGISGRVSAGTWSLRVLPETGFHVNGGDPSADPAVGYNAVLKRMLGILAKAIDEEQQGGINGVPVSETDGFNLIDLRPRTARGWSSWAELKAVALGGSRSKMEALQPYLALDAWVDTGVVAPNAEASVPSGQAYSSWGEYRMGRAVGFDGTRAPDLERINGRVVGRAPVGLHWARQRIPALLALFGGLKAQYLDDGGIFLGGAASSWGLGDRTGLVYPVEIVNAWSPADDAHAIAQQVAFIMPAVSTWAQWDAGVDTLMLPMLPLSNLVRKDMLKAMANPNTQLNKLNPNLSRFRMVDKSDFLVHSTELTLHPVCPYRIESAGRMLRNGKLLASRALQARSPGLSIERLSTQADFACEDLGRAGAHGDETRVRLPGYMIGGVHGYLSESQGAGKTWGHRLDVRSLSPAASYGTSWMDSDSRGVALQTYPEPCFRDPVSVLAARPAQYDGNLQLATVESVPEDFYTVPAATRDQKLLASFDDGLDLDVADGTAACQGDTGQASAAETGNGLYHASRPSLLMPEGVYSEKERAPGYLSLGNLPPTHGVLSFWMKANGGWRRCPYVTATNDSDGGGSGASTNQFFMLAGQAIHFEISHAASDQDQEHQFGSGSYMTSRVWRLVTAFWDFCGANAQDTGEFVLDDGSGSLRYSSNNYAGSTSSGLAQDLTLPDRLGAHVMALGTRAARDNYFNTEFGQGADATLDEFALYDFGGATLGGPAPADALAAPAALAQARFKEGRYYKGSVYDPPGTLLPSSGSAAAWVSGVLPIPAGARLRKVAWTWSRPAALPTDYAEIELLKDSADGWLLGEARSRSTLGSGWTRERQEWEAEGRLDAPFRLRAVFRRSTPVDDNTPILDSPALDDLTLLYEPPGGARLLDFGVAE